MTLKHFLIIRFSSIGDIVLTTSILSSLKKKWGENLKISYLTFEHFAAPLENNPYIDHLILVPKLKGLRGLLELVKIVFQHHLKHSIDLVMDLHSNTRTLALKICLPFLFFLSIDKRKIERFLLTKCKWNFYHFFQEKQETINQRTILDFISTMGWAKENEPTFISRKNVKEKTIFIMPAAAHEKKQWPLESFEILIEKILNDSRFKSYKVTLLGGPEDNFCEPLKNLEDSYGERFEYTQGQYQLSEVIDVISKGQLLIGNDTGLCHVAEALDLPIIMFMGPTSEYFGFSPNLEQSKLLYAHVPCRPCHHYGAGKCSQSEKFCLTKIKPEEVVEVLNSILIDRESE